MNCIQQLIIVVNAKNEVISNDNANKETILTTIKGWLKI